MASHGDDKADLPNPTTPGIVAELGRGPLVLTASRPPAIAEAPSAVSTMPDALGLLKALRRRWRLSLCGGLLCAMIAAAATWLLVPTALYSTHALLRVSSQQPRIIFQTNEAKDPFDTYLRSQLTLVKSRKVLNAALKRPEVASLDVVREQVYPVEWLERVIQVDYPGGAEILRIAMAGENPRAVATLVNGVKDSYMREIVDVEEQNRSDRFEQLSEIYKSYQERLMSERRAVRELAEQVGSEDKEINALTQQFALNHLHSAEEDLLEVRSELKRIEVDLSLRGPEESSVAVPSHVVEDILDEDPIVGRHMADILKVNDYIKRTVDYLSRVSRESADKDPTIRQMRLQLANSQKLLEARRAEIRPAIEERIRQEADAGARGAAWQDRRKLTFTRELEKLLVADVQRLTDDIKVFSRSVLDLNDRQRDISLAEDAAHQVGAELEKLKVELRAQPRITLLEDAEIPRIKGDDGRIKKTGMAAVGSFALVLLGVSLWEFRSRRIDSVHEVSQGLGLRIVGSLPALPARAQRLTSGERMPRDTYWDNRLIESVDATRTMLLHTAKAESIRSVMVCSALGGEGKTSLACHLSTSLGRSGQRTLLIDCDLRRPSIHHLFDMPPEPGFCELLRGEIEIEDAIQEASSNNLWLITAGRCDNHALQALTHASTRRIFERLKEQFDFIVVDTSPVLPVADSLSLAAHIDAVLFSILRNKSRVPTVHAAYDRLASLGARMLGAVVTGTQLDNSYGGYEYSTHTSAS